MSGELYRAKMRIIHRLGLCWPQQSGPEMDSVWCHWCGMRGRRTTAEQLAAAERQLGAMRLSTPSFDHCHEHGPGKAHVHEGGGVAHYHSLSGRPVFLSPEPTQGEQ